MPRSPSCRPRAAVRILYSISAYGVLKYLFTIILMAFFRTTKIFSVLLICSSMRGRNQRGSEGEFLLWILDGKREESGRLGFVLEESKP